ncbi:hypothetical protein [Streptomyces sp. NPDC058294]|uniref:hypothetical protein n=1 Tax=Streptomyces sp. NPDC058294 TaxID=3346430 RepID=UPI0036EBA7EA
MRSNSEAYSPQEFFQKLGSNGLASPVTLTGLIKEVPDEDGYASFTVGTKCTNWRRVPLELIESIEHLKSVPCDEHTHPLVKLVLKVSQSEEARLLVSFIADVQREAQRFIALSLKGGKKEGLCVQCLQSCAAVVDPGDVFPCLSYCGETYCP